MERNCPGITEEEHDEAVAFGLRTNEEETFFFFFTKMILYKNKTLKNTKNITYVEKKGVLKKCLKEGFLCCFFVGGCFVGSFVLFLFFQFFVVVSCCFAGCFLRSGFCGVV